MSISYETIYNQFIDYSFPKLNIHYLNRYIKLVLVLKEKDIKRTKGCQNHHILPRAFGGTNEIENLVMVTSRQHYLLHRLLWKGTRHPKAANAFMPMNHGWDHYGNLRNISSKEYERLRIDFCENMSALNTGNSYAKGSKRTLEERQQMSIERSGEGNAMFGRTHSKETRKKQSEKKQDYVPWNVGIEMPRCSCIFCRKELSQNNLSKHQMSYHKLPPISKYKQKIFKSSTFHERQIKKVKERKVIPELSHLPPITD
jgi:hypothetical protein